ncbi:MAG: SDR family oxidoreductase [Myxococcales bacterium]|nr:SDR family oxidoreductase [Myxococcales bacterium]
MSTPHATDAPNPSVATDADSSTLRLSGAALILGSSSGFGEAIALELARRGMDIYGVHLDRRSTMPHVERIVSQIRQLGRKAEFFNVNAADEGKRKEVADRVAAATEKDESPRVRVLVHSLAFGTLRPFVPPASGEASELIGKPHMDMTCDVMAHSLLYWTQDLLGRGLLSRGSRIFAMTSAGGHRVIGSYGAVSAAKAALESHVRQLAFELAPRGITSNSLCAGVTDTPALRKIPGSEAMMRVATQRNPAGRLTTPQDVANAVAVLSHPLSGWITGNVIHVDGGEDIAG